MSRTSKISDETIAALKWHFSTHTVTQVTGVHNVRCRAIEPFPDDELIEDYLDDTRLKRVRLGHPEYLDITIMRGRGMKDRDIRRTLPYSWSRINDDMDTLLRRIVEEGEVFYG